ncbi:MAG TPA: hypothetical protein VG370_30180 [Chloroflexota bacterium]|nr:hypothetical protein [Chloroflexota bacterium]
MSRLRAAPVRTLLLGAVALVLWWLLPLEGQVVVTGGAGPSVQWPRMELDPPAPAPGSPATLTVTDAVAWPHVALMVDGRHVRIDPQAEIRPGVWTWRASFPAPAAGRAYDAVFYRDCHQGCVERGRLGLGAQRPASQARRLMPTKLGVVFAAPDRDWHGRQGWDVELLYCTADDEQRWGLHGLADVVQAALGNGLRVLVRVAYDRQQSLPPRDDQIALTRYLTCVERAARDSRLREVYGWVIGSGYNTAGENARANGRATTPEWYARVFNGYGFEPSRNDNVVARIRSANPSARVLVGPVTPWSEETDARTDEAPWLRYMNAVVSAIDRATREKAVAGVALAGPDGFAVQAPGRPDAPTVRGREADEPRLDLPHPVWSSAQGGFRVYRDWLAIVNRHPSTSGLPLYVTATNTFAPDAPVPPAQSYRPGWLRTAAEVVETEPQVHALIWFLDDPTGDGAWDFFSLATRPGRLADAAADLDRLLARP